MRRRNYRSGFGLIEILVVLAIMCVLAVFLIPRLTGGKDPATGKTIASPRDRAKQAGGASYVNQINQAIQMYRMDHDNENPPNLQALKTYGVMDEMLLDHVTKQPLPYNPQTGVVGAPGARNGGADSIGGVAIPRVGGY